MKIILTNGTELNPINAIGGKRNVQGATRDTISFIFPAETSLDELDTLFVPENCEKITIVEQNTVVEQETIVDEEGNESIVEKETVVENEYIHTGYTVRAELKREPVEVAPATESEEAVFENRVTVAMSQRTYTESQLSSLTETVDVLVMESLMA